MIDDVSETKSSHKKLSVSYQNGIPYRRSKLDCLMSMNSEKILNKNCKKADY